MNTKSKELKVKVLLLITGSIAAVRIPLLVSQLVKDNYEIKCVVSELSLIHISEPTRPY